ncbi:MAG: UDP-N-acetylmuramate dehydrogenase [Gammaproteobacteria bacterium]
MSANSTVRHSEPMASHTSWRVGGAADLFFEPQSIEELKQFLASLPGSTPVTWVGLGSNLLVRDGGIRGAVVSSGALPKVFETQDDGTVRCSAALPCATLAKRAARAGLGPAAFFAGIPGSLGGALAMNAGAFGGETWDSVVAVETIDRAGVRHDRQKAEYTIGYRSVRGPEHEWFLGAVFEFSVAQESEPQKIRALLRERNEKQPLGLPSAGSVFRNPDGGHAGELIERVGLKGARRGGAVVSEKHANFIINDGSATAADVEGLIGHIRERVLEVTGIELVPEVRIIGEAGEP